MSDPTIPMGQTAPQPMPQQTAQIAPPAPQQTGAKPPPPAPGQVMNGYKFVGGDPASPQSWQQVQGQPYLATLPQSDQNIVQMMVQGRLAPPTSFAIAKPYWQQKLQEASQYDPTFDESIWPARVATRRDFAAGKSAQAVTSFNTVMQHLGRLSTSADALNNGAVPAWNAVENWALVNTGDPRVDQFNTDAQAVSDELTRAFRMTGGNVSDIKDWQSKIDAAKSPAQLHGIVVEALHLLNGRMESLAGQYQRTMGKSPPALLSPGAQKTYQALTQKYDQSGNVQQQTAPTSRTATDSKGKVWRETPGGKWIDSQGREYKP